MAGRALYQCRLCRWIRQKHSNADNKLQKPFIHKRSFSCCTDTDFCLFVWGPQICIPACLLSKTKMKMRAPADPMAAPRTDTAKWAHRGRQEETIFLWDFKKNSSRWTLQLYRALDEIFMMAWSIFLSSWRVLLDLSAMERCSGLFLLPFRGGQPNYQLFKYLQVLCLHLPLFSSCQMASKASSAATRAGTVGGNLALVPARAGCDQQTFCQGQEEREGETDMTIIHSPHRNHLQ